MRALIPVLLVLAACGTPKSARFKVERVRGLGYDTSRIQRIPQRWP